MSVDKSGGWQGSMWKGVAPMNNIYTTSQAIAVNANHDAKRVALDLDLLLISSAPSNHAG
ncbi:hypothetical protein CUU62_07860 [Pseudomonas sp. WP001]|nr:hypothetical protein CUU62_07860 [Pseudomonas sp. WP001]